MRKLFAIIAMIAIFGQAGAQISHSAQGQSDKVAPALLKKAAARFEQSVSFDVAASFSDGSQKQTSAFTAHVLYNKGAYRIETTEQDVICDGKTVWQWNKQAGEVAVNNMDNEELSLLNPARLLKNYDEWFRAKYIRTEPDGTAVIDLQPRMARSYHKIRLLVDEKSGLLKQMEVHKYDSSREIYVVSAFKKAGHAGQFVFEPEKHPGVEIIDMR